MFSATFALEIAVKCTAVLAIANLLAFVFRKNSARSRMLLWRATAIALLALPFLSWMTIRVTPSAMLVLPPITTTTGQPRASHIASVDAIVAIAVVWMTVAVLLVIRVLAAHWLIWRSVRRDILDTDPVVTSSAVTAPVAWGILRPRVLLPADQHRWHADQLDMVIAHEMRHVTGRDCMWQFVAQVATALYWFHPLAWRLLSQLRDETEFYCDEVLLALGYKPSAYAETLLAFANVTSRFDRLCPVTVAVARRTTIGRRIQRILTMQKRVPFGRASAVAAILAFALVFPIAAMQSGKSDKVYKIGEGVTPPVPIYKEEPKYTKEAKDEKIQGSVALEVVIGPDGHVSEVSVLRGLDAGLDQNAVDAVKTWTFEPATKDGKPVAVRARIEINFRLK